jgi:hypothetical protein
LWDRSPRPAGWLAGWLRLWQVVVEAIAMLALDFRSNSDLSLQILLGKG